MGLVLDSRVYDKGMINDGRKKRNRRKREKSSEDHAPVYQLETP
jgi:hypothetical protein